MNRKLWILAMILGQAPSLSTAQQNTSEDEYTRYELLDPSTQQFRILYEVSATEPGARTFYNTLRKGSEHKVDHVMNMATGDPLPWKVVDGAEAARNGYTSADRDTEYLQIQLPYPIARGAAFRLKIDKTYKDTDSYFTKDGRIIFERTLGIKKNCIVLPLRYEVVACNYPVQVIMEPDGRLALSFFNSGPSEVPLHIEGRKLPDRTNLIQLPHPPDMYIAGEGRDKSKARVNFQIPERAHQTREIVYFLQQPETHSFSLYHDYTETREGHDKYLNVVRPGSKVANPSAINLDTGEPLKVETLKGKALIEKGIELEEEITPETEVVVISYPPVVKGHSIRLRIQETYTDPDRYVLDNNELVWDRAFGRVENTVILPDGWFLTGNAIPATISLTPDEKILLYYANYRPDEIDVFLRGRRR